MLKCPGCKDHLNNYKINMNLVHYCNADKLEVSLYFSSTKEIDQVYLYKNSLCIYSNYMFKTTKFREMGKSLWTEISFEPDLTELYKLIQMISFYV